MAGFDVVVAEASGVALLILGALFVAMRSGRRERFFGLFAVIWGAQVVLANLGRALENPGVHAPAFLLSFALAPPAYLFLGHLGLREVAGTRARVLTTLLMLTAGAAGAVLLLAPNLVVQPTPGSFASTLGPAAVPLFIVPFFGAFFLGVGAFYHAYRSAAEDAELVRARSYVQALALFATYAGVRQTFVYLAPPSSVPAVDGLEAASLAAFFLGGVLLLLGIAAHLVLRPMGRNPDMALAAAFLLPAGWAAAEAGFGMGFFPDSAGLFRLATVATLMFQLQHAELLDAFTALERKERQLQARIGEAQTLNRALHRSEERYRSVLESTEVGYCEVDLRGRVTFANQYLGIVLGREVAVGAPLPERLGGAGLRDAFVRATAGGGAGRGTASVGPRWVEYSIAPLHDASGLLTGHRFLLRDVTEQRRVEDERRRSNERAAEIARLQELDRLKTQFINTAAHELCTPLTPIKLQVEMLREVRAAGLSPAQVRSLDILERNVDRLSELVSDVLAVARLQAGRLSVAQEPVDVDLVLRDAVESFRDVAARAGVRMSMRAGSALHVTGDAKRLSQVLFNLLDNAVKFTPAGGEIVVEAVKTSREVVLHVGDTGAGIAPGDVEKLFQPFSQVHDTSQMTRPGTGLGLYISRGIVELHGGSLTCVSPGRGQGTTFTVALPCREVHAAPRSHALPPAAR